MKIVRKHIGKSAPTAPLRQWLGYVLLICFLNTIVFPDIHVPVAIKKWQKPSSIFTDHTSLTEYMLVDYLDIEDSTPVHPGEDVEDILKTIDDLDLLDHVGLSMNFAQFSKKNNMYRRASRLPQYRFYPNSTPPPEC